MIHYCVLAPANKSDRFNVIVFPFLCPPQHHPISRGTNFSALNLVCCYIMLYQTRQLTRFLELFVPYGAALDERHALPLEKSLCGLEELWTSMDITSLRAALSDPETGGRLTSMHEGYIIRVWVFSRSRFHHF